MDNSWNDVCTEANACALTGAAAFFAGIPGAVIIINGQVWCYYYVLRYLEKQNCDLASRCFCSQVDNTAVIYGTEEALTMVLTAVVSLKPTVVLIENSCSVGLIGDDIAGIAAQVGFECPVITLDSGGLKGDFWAGWRLAAKQYFTVVPLQQRRKPRPLSVNLLGCNISYYNNINDLKELKRMLGLLGCTVAAAPGAGSSMAEIAAMSEATVNIVVHEELGIELAEFFKQQYGIPYISLWPPYGFSGSLDWLSAVANSLALTPTALAAARAERDHNSETTAAEILSLERLWGNLCVEQLVVAGPGSVALALGQAVRLEWVDTDQLTVISHSGACQQPLPTAVDNMLLATDAQAVRHSLSRLDHGLLLGSSTEKALLYKQSQSCWFYQAIAVPVYDEVILSGQSFMGFCGAKYLAENLWNRYLSYCQREASLLRGRQ